MRYGARSRVDLLLEGSEAGEARQPCWVEIKSVTVMRRPGLAEFPDAVTARGARHLEELAAQAAAGQRAVMLFLVLIGSAERHALAADIDPAYAAAFVRARAAGVEAIACRCAVSPAGIEVMAPIPVEEPAAAPPATVTERSVSMITRRGGRGG